MVVIVDYGMGNLASVLKACILSRSDTIISNDPDVITSAEKIILPGVGAFGDGMKALEATGLKQVVLNVASNGTPVLGICLGMQLLGKQSEESQGVRGLGLLDFDVVKFNTVTNLKVPHVGWNNVMFTSENPLFSDVSNGLDFYFVHSFHVASSVDPNLIIATTEYGEEFVSVVGKSNVIGAQFHPEKSQKAGLQMLKNFLTSFEGLKTC